MVTMTQSIGVLALQGAVSEHIDAIQRAGAKAFIVKTAEQLAPLDGIIIPGGESTTIRRLMKKYQLFEPLRAFAHAGNGIFGTCAGLVLLAKEIEGGDEGLDLIDCCVRRNGFGRQKESFETPLALPAIGEQPFPAVFIRAPLITEVGDGVEVLARYDNDIVAVKWQNILATAFHPELSDDNRLMNYFIRCCLS
jgi:5'-phosphate synthase pdxT subunit